MAETEVGPFLVFPVVISYPACTNTLVCHGKAPHPMRRGEAQEQERGEKEGEVAHAHLAASCARRRDLSAADGWGFRSVFSVKGGGGGQMSMDEKGGR